MYSSSIVDKTVKIPVNKLEECHTSHQQKENGAIFDKKPFKLTLEAGKIKHFSILLQFQTFSLHITNQTKRTLGACVESQSLSQFAMERTRTYT